MRNAPKENDGTFVRAGGNHVPVRILVTLGTHEMKMFGPGAGLAPYPSQPEELRRRDAWR